MAVVATELKIYKASVMSDGSSNGGHMSNNAVTTAVKNAILPDVSQDERTAGLAHRYRKVFGKVENDDDLGVNNSVVHFTSVTPGDDYVALFGGTQASTEADISSPRRYGCIVIDADITATDTSFTGQLENTGLNDTFVTADKVWIGDGTNEEYHSNVTIAIVGTTVTVTLDSGDEMQNDYTSGAAWCASVLEPGTVTGTSTEPVVSGTGTLDYDNSGDIIVVDNIAGVTDTWTATVQSDLDTFTVSGARTGAVANGSLSADYAPPNSNFSNKPFMTLPSSGWSGTPVSGDTFTWSTVAASTPVWFDQTVPSGSGSYSGNGFTFRFGGESE